jgi:hypothetical protein
VSSYCTFFDRGYLAQGLALWDSLQRHEPAAELWVLALDEETDTVLRSLAQPGLRVVSLAELLAADPSLAAVQSGRTRQEFIFTLKPCLCRYLLREKHAADVLTYVDADLYFFGEAAAIRRELADASVFLVPHRYPPWHDDRSRYGCFNAGVLAFRDDAPGRACLDRWREQCLESCSLAANGVSYGDQKYLDEWPERYGAKVCVSRNSGLNLAPWNWARHVWVVGPPGVQVDGAPLLAFHFAQFRRISTRWFDSGQLEYGIMPLGLRSQLYGEYWAALVAAEKTVRRVRPDYAVAGRGWRASLGPWHLGLLRLFCGQFWFRLGPWWVAGRLGLGQFSGRMMAIYRGWQRRSA